MKDTMQNLAMDMIIEISQINTLAIKPSKKLRKLALLHEKAKARFTKIGEKNGLNPN